VGFRFWLVCNRLKLFRLLDYLLFDGIGRLLGILLLWILALSERGQESQNPSPSLDLTRTPRLGLRVYLTLFHFTRSLNYVHRGKRVENGQLDSRFQFPSCRINNSSHLFLNFSSFNLCFTLFLKFSTGCSP
jgi:hypothetical protein